MLLGLCVIATTCLGWALAATVGRPVHGFTRRRQLRHHPERANRLDVENLLLADSIPAATVHRVLRRADTYRIGARTLWRWADRHGSDKVVLVVDADLAEQTLLDQLDAGTVPDWQSLGVFAGLNNDDLPGGMPLDELLDLDVVPAMVDLTFMEDLADWATAVESQAPDRFDTLPPVSGPGVAPSSPTGISTDISTGISGGDDDWPAVA